MPCIYLIHWNADEAEERAARLQKIGYNVRYDRPSPAILREIRKTAPDIFLIDLTRLPSQGRDVALNLRQSKATRFVPIVFVGGAQEKVDIVKRHLPDATYATWDNIKSALKQSISHPPKDPVVPRSALEGYAGAPLIKKLGIKTDSYVALLGAPMKFKETFGELPGDVRFTNKADIKCDLIIWFVKLQKICRERIDEMAASMGDKSGLWMAWPKKTSGVKSDLTQNIVRRIGLEAGLVDYKICSIDITWSGLKFRKRKINP